MLDSPITEDQESTLHRWASFYRKRPDKRDEAFLQAEKGLSKEQIDHWFKNIADLDESKKNTQNLGLQPQNFDAPAQSISQDTEMIMVDIPSENFPHHQFLEGLDFDSLDFSTMFSSDVQEFWSPICAPQEGVSNHPLPLPMLEPPLKSSLWSPTMASQGCFPRSTLSSINQSSPLLSPPSLQPSFLSQSDNSSYESSLRTWDTSSTLVSTFDSSLDDLKDCEYRVEEAHSVQLKTPPVSRFSRQPSVKEIRSGHTRAQSDIQVSSNIKFMAPQTPAEMDRVDETYKCTVCSKGFSRKGDWKRHEEGHDPHTLWTCMLGETLIRSKSRWTCAFCDIVRKNRDEMTQHLMEQHKVFRCALKKPMFARKDKLKQHLQQVHALSETSVIWESWHQPARQKWAWGCGYCGACLFTWEGRMIHLADHYEKQPRHVPRWSRSLVVEGLLKQAKDVFNVSRAWKQRAGSDFSAEGDFEWPREAAISLKHRLEYHDGTPEQLAAEAFRLARFAPKPHSSDRSWLEQASTAAILGLPMSSNIEVDIPHGLLLEMDLDRELIHDQLP